MDLKVSIAEMFSLLTRTCECLCRRRCDGVRLLSEVLGIIASLCRGVDYHGVF